ncbi:hypothetical protein AB0K15_46030 [Amycolatopsis sp. NPDC049253]
MDPLAAGIRALAGMRLVEIRRIVNIVVVVFRSDAGDDHAIHA